MRIFILFSIMFLSISSVMMAQDIRFGLKGGFNISNISKSDLNGEPVTSLQMGGMMEALYSETIALQPEIIFSLQGFDYMENGIQRHFKTTYINVPIMVKYFVFKGISLEGGPQVGFLNTAKLTIDNPNDSETINIKQGLRSNDLSLNLGIGFQFSNGLNFGARYNYGLTNIVGRLSDDRFKNRVLQCSIGYFF